MLLSGTLPFDPEELRARGIEHVRQTIRQIDPKTPSTRIAKLGPKAQSIAESRGTQVATLSRNLRKQLEWIPLKAMRKERSERYRSASELTDDIENYLNGAPLIAGPPTMFYRLKKFVRRNAVLSGAVLAVVGTLILGLAGTTAMYLQAERAQAKEALARKVAEAISDFLFNNIMDNTKFSKGQEFDVEQYLDNVNIGLEHRFRDLPLVQARILTKLADANRRMGRLDTAEKQLKRAYQIRVQHLGPEDLQTSTTANQLCWVYWFQDRIDDAIQLWTEQIEITQEAYGEGIGRALMYMMNIGQAHSALGNYKEAEK